MVRVCIELENIDFDALMDRYLPQIGEQLRSSGSPVGMLLSNGMSSAMAKGVLRSLSQEKKEQLAADLINGERARLSSAIEGMAGQQGVRLRVRALEAKQKN